ncbi:O-antigen ligase family protein [Chryseobacterium arthrosphaerae]|uniref:O-antigen ligase family protein n=1 Tax=Chryseobacterium arthrosphaerae TaxID=651561 RepID=UPI001E5C8271|nr:O-antigen ligase family protein [Chryseobacterium arthrosphaerae]UEQ78719.1 O-antigen ligase family protein [Chryseobacterium arthrosphaerae]
MEIIKKSNIEFLFIFFLTFGYIFFYSFSRQLDTSNEYFAVPFRVVLFLVSCYIIVVNFENLKKRKLSVIFTALFWLFYLAKSIYSFKNDSYQQKILNNEEKIYIRILCLNLIPYIAVLSINFSKEIIVKLNNLIFNFLLIILGISCLYTIFIYQAFEKSSGIFAGYYITTGHYGLSLLIISIFYYFQSSQKKLKPIFGILIGIFTVFSASARSPMLAAFIILFILLIYVNELKYWVGLLFFTLIFILSIYILKQTSVADFEFVTRMYDAIFEGNGYGRFYYLTKGWDIFKNNIPFGGRILFEDGLYPHNIFIEVLMSMGIFGIILFFLYFKDVWKFKIKYITDNIYYLPFILFFIQYFVLVLTSYNIFANLEFWTFSAVFISIILFCNDEEIKSNDRRRNAAGDH